MAYLNQRYVLISFGLLAMALGSSGVLTSPFPSNTAVVLGTSGVVLFCASTDGPDFLSWSYFPVGGSGVVNIGTGVKVVPSLSQSYKAEASGLQQSNLTIINATASMAGTYYCSQGTSQVSAQLIVINSDPMCVMTPNTTELLWNQTVQMSCNIIYTATSSYVAVDMIWSKDNPFTIVNSTYQTSTSANLTTTVSTITQTPGNSTPFPIYRCITTFKVIGSPPPTGSASNVPGYSKTTFLFNSPINVIYLNPADANSIMGAESGSVPQGTTVKCQVEGNPPPNYSWLDVTHGNTTNSSEIQLSYDGEYKCTAWNSAGSTSVSINVTTYTTTAAPTTSTRPTTTGTSSRSTSPNGSGSGDTTATTKDPVAGGLSERDKIIVGVVVGVGGALVIAAVAILIYCCMKKKSKTEKYSGGSDGTLSKPPPYDERDGHRGPQPSSNPDIIRQAGYPMDDFPKRYTAGVPDTPYIVDDGLTYSEMQLDNNPRSRQPLKPAEQSNYVDVGFA